MHGHLKRVRGRRRRIVTPQTVDQAVARDDLVRVQEQQREHGSLPLTARAEDGSAALHLQRPEDPELERLAVRQAAIIADRRRD